MDRGPGRSVLPASPGGRPFPSARGRSPISQEAWPEAGARRCRSFRRRRRRRNGCGRAGGTSSFRLYGKEKLGELFRRIGLPEGLRLLTHQDELRAILQELIDPSREVLGGQVLL